MHSSLERLRILLNNRFVQASFVLTVLVSCGGVAFFWGSSREVPGMTRLETLSLLIGFAFLPFVAQAMSLACVVFFGTHERERMERRVYFSIIPFVLIVLGTFAFSMWTARPDPRWGTGDGRWFPILFQSVIVSALYTPFCAILFFITGMGYQDCVAKGNL